MAKPSNPNTQVLKVKKLHLKSFGFSNEPFSDAASNAFRDENASHIHHSCTPIFFPRMKKKYVMK